MREISRFQKNTRQALNTLQSQIAAVPHGYGSVIYEKFRESRQEPIRLAAALTGFFERSGVTAGEKAVYEDYLRIHIRNAMEACIEADAPEQLEALAAKGWFGRQQLDEFIRTARERQKRQALIWLLRYKDREYGYAAQEYQL